MSVPVIAFIGAGNMGSSLINGLIHHGHLANNIWATDASQEKLLPLKNNLGIHITADNNEAAKHADVLIFAVKPQVFAEVAAALAPALTRKPLIISIAAGIREQSIQHWLGGNMAIVRTMPNTPALVGAGATAMYANNFVSAEQHKLATDIMQAVGIAVWVNDENLLDVVTALSGSGPAYFFFVMEAMQTAAEELGLDAQTARLLTQQTALGAARMAIENAVPLAALRKNVTSPGGTTEKGISVLEKHLVNNIFKQTLVAAHQRSKELAGENK